jgi:ABC-2 type transport system ATP-binding protein
MIVVKQLSKYYGDFCAVDSLSFEVGKGQVIGLLGPNGAGKTTTMKIMTGFMPASSGIVQIAGMDIRENPEEIQQKIGYLPETNPMYPEMTVQEYLAFFAGIRGIKGAQRRSAIARMVDACSIGEVFHKPIGMLSKGYRQRVGLAQAMLHDPEILILDEPTSGLDPNQIVDILKLIRDLGSHKTVIHSTHILSEAQETCDQVLILSKGKLVAHDSPGALSGSASGHKVHLGIAASADYAQEIIQSTLQTQLKELGMIEWVQATNDSNSFVIALTKGKEHHAVCEKIGSIALQNNWAICELKYESPSLDEVFSTLTREVAS